MPVIQAQGVDLAGQFAVGYADLQNGLAAIVSGGRKHIIVGKQERVAQNQIPLTGGLFHQTWQPLQPLCSPWKSSLNIPDKIQAKL